METVLEFDMREFSRQFRQFIQYSKRSIEEEFVAQSKSLIKMIVDITPPAHGKGTRGKARRMGQNKIAGDLLGGRGSGRRAGIFTVVSDSLIDQAAMNYAGGDNVRLWVRSDGSVYGTQPQYFRPDATLGELKAHHDSHFRNGKMAGAGGFNRKEGRFEWISNMVVRESTFKKYLGTQQRNVGFYAAGFRPAMMGVGLPIPAYMKNHRAVGTFHLDLEGDNLAMTAMNAVGYGSIDGDLQRRINFAISATARGMERQLPYLIRAHERIIN